MERCSRAFVQRKGSAIVSTDPGKCWTDWAVDLGQTTLRDMAGNRSWEPEAARPAGPGAEALRKEGLCELWERSKHIGATLKLFALFLFSHAQRRSVRTRLHSPGVVSITA